MTTEGKILRLVEESRSQLACIILKKVSNTEKLQKVDEILLHVAREIQLLIREGIVKNDSNDTATR